MYELTKKRRVSEAVEQAFPAEVLKQVWDVITLMSKGNLLVTSPVAVIFADDYTDDECYAMVVQGDAAMSQEFTLDYSGEKTFLGHGWILIVKDRPKSVTMAFSEANTDQAANNTLD